MYVVCDRELCSPCSLQILPGGAQEMERQRPWDMEELEQNLGDLAAFFARNKQSLLPIVVVGMMGQIYKYKARRIRLFDNWWGCT